MPPWRWDGPVAFGLFITPGGVQSLINADSAGVGLGTTMRVRLQTVPELPEAA